MRRLVGIFALWALACVAAAAADFWETKPFLTWTDKELQQVTTDSPWVRNVSVAPPARGEGDGGGGGGGRGGGRGGRGGGPLNLAIMWRTALPMKEALVRSQVGLGGKIPAESEALLARAEDGYILTVVGLPMQLKGATANLKMETALKAGEKAPILPDEAIAQANGNTLMLVFAFPKKMPITLEDREVEFVTKLGALEIKKKFNLKEMIFHGQLEL